MKIIHPDGISLPIYKCNGYRNYGIDLCEDEKLNINLIKEFYLNPKRRADFPINPKNATVKFIVNGSSTLESTVPMIEQVKSMRNKIGEVRLTKLPFLLSIQTIRKDSTLIKPPKTVN